MRNRKTQRENHQIIDIRVQMAHAHIEKRSVCDCGNIATRHEIGHRYLVLLDSVCTGTLICGGCGKEQPIRLIKFLDQERGGWCKVPLDLLDIGPYVAQKKEVVN